MMALATGMIPFGLTDTGWMVSADSLAVKVGSAPMGFDHWEDSDYVFSRPATWIVGSDGVFISHWLDLAIPQEFEMYTKIQGGYIGFSWGRGAAPEQTRAAVKKVAAAGGVTQLTQPKVMILPTEHWTYTPRPAVNQPAVKITERTQ